MCVRALLVCHIRVRVLALCRVRVRVECRVSSVECRVSSVECRVSSVYIKCAAWSYISSHADCDLNSLTHSLAVLCCAVLRCAVLCCAVLSLSCCNRLQVGNIGLSHTEQVAHFALWCLITGACDNPVSFFSSVASGRNDHLQFARQARDKAMAAEGNRPCVATTRSERTSKKEGRKIGSTNERCCVALCFVKQGRC